MKHSGISSFTRLLRRTLLLCLAMLLLAGTALAAEGDYTRTDSTPRIAASTKSTSNSDKCLIKSTPFEDGTTLSTVGKGGVIYITGKVVNKYSNTWYVTESGGFVYSGDVDIKVDNASFSVKSNSRSIAVLTEDDYVYVKPYSASGRTAVSEGDHVLLVQKVVNSYGNTWYKTSTGKYIYSGCISTPASYITVNTTELLGVSIKDASASDACFVKKTPFEDGATVRTVQKNAPVVFSAKVKNMYGNIWYKTSDGYFVYSGDVEFRDYVEVSCSVNLGVSIKGYDSSDPCYVKKTPFESGTTVRKIEKKNTTTITGAVRNKYNNLWYRTSEGFIYSGDLEAYKTTTLFSIYAKFRNTDVRYSHVAPYKDAYNKNLIAAGATVTVRSLVLNSEGNIWARLADGSYLCFYDAGSGANRLKFVSLINSPVVNVTAPSGDLSQGSVFNLGGTVTTEAPILYMTGSVIFHDTGLPANGSNTPVTVYPAATLRTLDLAKTQFSGKTINSMTSFSQIDSGMYAYRLFLQLGFTHGGKTFKFGSETRVFDSSFTVGAGQSPLSITKQPSHVTVPEGTTASTTVTASGTGLKYAWYYKNLGQNGFIRSSVTTATYSVTMDAQRHGRQIYCVITDAYGRTAQTQTVTLRLTSATTLSITKHPASVSALSGAKATVSVTAKGDGLTYQWYYKDPGMSGFSKSSITASTYSVTMTSARAGRKVYCTVTDKYGHKANSVTVTLSMAASVAITGHPASVSVVEGDTARTYVTATGTGLTYQWFYKNPGMSAFAKSSLTGSAYYVAMTPAKSGRQVYCVVTDKAGAKVQSRTATLTMAVKAAITRQPASVTVAVGSVAKTTVTAKGDGLTYQWYYKDPGMSAYGRSSLTGATYSVTLTAAKAGRQVYCVVTDKYGSSVKSAVATLNVK